MKALITFLFTFILSAQANNDDIFKREWSLVRDNGMSTVWKAINAKNTYASITTKIKDKFSNHELLKDENFYEEIISKKKKMLAFTGISDWVASSHQWISHERKNETHLMIKGTYRDHRSTLISFVEVHKYDRKNVTQILYTQNAMEKSNDELLKMLFQKHGVIF